jgi:hypothetical protein
MPLTYTLVLGQAPRVDKYSLKIIGTIDEKELTLYINQIVQHRREQSNPIDKESIIFIKKVTDERYKLSLITNFGESITINAFSSLPYARKCNSKIVSKKKNYKNSTKRKSLKSKVLIRKKQKNKSNKEPKNSMMALALKKALKQRDEK